MSVTRFGSIGLILVGVATGWWVLGTTVQVRTDQLDTSLSAEMASLWGPRTLAQASPYCVPAADAARASAGAVATAASTITADVRHQHRYKGLLWYSTFDVDFTGEYKVLAPAAAVAAGAAASAPAPAAGRAGDANAVFVFPLPAGVTTYHALSVTVDDKPVAIATSDIPAGRLAVPLARGVEHVVTVHYVTGGQDTWLYSPGEAPQCSDTDDKPVIRPTKDLNELRSFSLTVTTDFQEIDYPRGTLSPKQQATPVRAGMQAEWKYPNLITSQAIGLAMPKRPNAGPIVARMSFFAPVSLLFFYAVLFAVVVLKRVPLHPMHYLFIAAGFFAFHILMSYLADLVSIHVAFWIAAAVSVFLVATYMRLVAGVKFALVYTGLAQLVFLVGFSYAFFWVGRTGLTVTICAVVTLFVLMQATGRVDWHAVFRFVPPPTPPTVLTPAANPAGLG